MSKAPDKSRIACLHTTFPVGTETFVQREVRALAELGVELELWSMHGGDATWEGFPVRRMAKWRLLAVLWQLPLEWSRQPKVFGALLRALIARKPPSWLNFWENALGIGFALVEAPHFRRHPPAAVHAVWSGGPATAAWLLHQLCRIPYLAGAHAYDLFEHGGDWLLELKLNAAAAVRTSSESGRARLLQVGCPPAKICLVRRGLNRFPALKPLRARREPLRLLCVARLVEKKGLIPQIRIYAALREAGVAFQVRICGEGPLRKAIEREIAKFGLADRIALLGHVPAASMVQHFAWADALLHTGVVAPSGDRDGLPNAIPEAMAAGVCVVSSPVSGAAEAVMDQVTGLLADPHRPASWVEALRCLQDDDELSERLRLGGRKWVEDHFDARANGKRLRDLMLDVAQGQGRLAVDAERIWR
jgi:colanic acid/amylovoran biosynthesis glycosyltransferase